MGWIGGAQIRKRFREHLWPRPTRVYGLPEQRAAQRGGFLAIRALGSEWWKLPRCVDMFQPRHICLLLAYIPNRQSDAMRKASHISTTRRPRGGENEYVRVIHLRDNSAMTSHLAGRSALEGRLLMSQVSPGSSSCSTQARQGATF